MMLSFVNTIVILGLLTPNLSNAYKTSFYTSSEFGIEGKPAIKDCSAIVESVGETASIDRLECLLSNEFSLPRHHTVNPQNKEKTRSFLLNSMKQYADEVAVQSFDQPGEVDVKGINIIATIAGTKRNTSDDNLVLIGAHYDTFLTPNDVTAGIDDNGSGLAVLLEVLRLVSTKYRASSIKPTNSIMFVAFDFEEYGYVGSQLFVNSYLIPYELAGKKSASFQGAFIMDTIMNYNTTKGAQLLPDLVELIAPEIENWVNNVNEKMGDFLALISRETLDTSLTNAFVTHWKSIEPDNSFKMLPVNFPVEYEAYAGELLRSDHASFWYHDFTKYKKQLPAVFLTDTGNYRGVMIDCYHRACDDSRLITKENLSWLQQIANTLFKSIVSLAN